MLHSTAEDYPRCVRSQNLAFQRSKYLPVPCSARSESADAVRKLASTMGTPAAVEAPEAQAAPPAVLPVPHRVVLVKPRPSRAAARLPRAARASFPARANAS